MDYEKAYKGARERCRWQLANKLISEECATDLFRDIKESEDERIRKTLLRCCDDWDKGQFGCMKKEDVASIRAYLERQKEQSDTEKELVLHDTFGYEEGRQTGQNEGVELVLNNPEKYGLQKEQKFAEVDVKALLTADRLAHAEMTGRLKERRAIINNPEKYGLTQPIEWSEEDERIISNLIRYFKCEEALRYSEEKTIAWLKSLRPQPHWKPSEEQISILGKVFAGCKLNTSERDSMVDLFYHLKDMI